MIKITKCIDIFPSETGGYCALVQDTEGDYYTVDTENFDDAYSLKRILEELPFGQYFEMEEESNG